MSDKRINEEGEDVLRDTQGKRRGGWGIREVRKQEIKGRKREGVGGDMKRNQSAASQFPELTDERRQRVDGNH